MEFDTLEATKDRLLNWQRAYRDHKSKRVTMSLEGRYKSPQHWDEKEVHAVVNLLDAHKVESAWLGLPAHNKAILKYNYFTPYIPLQIFCRKINRMRADHFELELALSIRMMDNRLRG